MKKLHKSLLKTGKSIGLCPGRACNFIHPAVWPQNWMSIFTYGVGKDLAHHLYSNPKQYSRSSLHSYVAESMRIPDKLKSLYSGSHQTEDLNSTNKK